MKRSHFLHQLGAASAALALSSCRSMLPDATRPMRTLYRFFTRSFLQAHQLAEIEGGHDWTCWKQGAQMLLS